MPGKAKLEPPITQPLPQINKPVPPAKSKPVPAKVENQTFPEEAPVLSLEAEPVAPATTSARTKQRFVAKQEEMQFETATRGRFEKTHETMYRGENLDQPTFRRRGLKIKV